MYFFFIILGQTLINVDLIANFQVWNSVLAPHPAKGKLSLPRELQLVQGDGMVNVHSVSLSFRLSVSGQKAIRPYTNSAFHTQKYK